jgi:FkbM family methyltransferase
MYMPKAERDRLKVYNVAIGDTNGPIDFYVIDETQGDSNAGAASKFKFKPGMNGSFYNQNWVQKPVTVNQYRLDDFVPRYINMPVDILWIDVQGSELFAFKGAEQTLKDTKLIFTEVGLQAYYEGQSLKPQIDEFLGSLGFTEITEAFELNGFEYEGNTVYKRT